MPDRILDLTDGIAMVVTDLHGDRDAFDRYIDEFRYLYETGEVQRLILLGDLIHFYGPPPRDSSLSMVLDLIALRDELGPEAVIMLLGNHEMPHIYSISLAKGELEFTPRFEYAMGQHRDRILSFFRSLPFFVRTAAGVMLTHAGAALQVVDHVDLLRHFDHDTILKEADDALIQAGDLNDLYKRYSSLYGAPYAEEAEYYLGVYRPDDPRYSHLLRAFMISKQSQPFKVLWDALFTQNELGLTELVYLQGCQQFLSVFSEGAPVPQRVLVSGHIVTPLGGYVLVNRCQLRLSSAAHARPREAGKFLLLNCAKPVRGANELLVGLRSVFDDDDDDDY